MLLVSMTVMLMVATLMMAHDDADCDDGGGDDDADDDADDDDDDDADDDEDAGPQSCCHLASILPTSLSNVQKSFISLTNSSTRLPDYEGEGGGVN